MNSTIPSRALYRAEGDRSDGGSDMRAEDLTDKRSRSNSLACCKPVPRRAAQERLKAQRAGRRKCVESRKSFAPGGRQMRSQFSSEVSAPSGGVAKQKPPRLYSPAHNASSGDCMSEQASNIESALQENRLFPPSI